MDVVIHSLKICVKLNSLVGVGLFFCKFFRDFRDAETPGPIPNPEAKCVIVDNTAVFNCGNVDRCEENTYLPYKDKIMIELLIHLAFATYYIHKLIVEILERIA